MSKAVLIVFSAIIALSCGQYQHSLRQQHWPIGQRGGYAGNIGYAGNSGYGANSWAQPGYAGGYGAGYRATGAYGGTNRGYGGAAYGGINRGYGGAAYGGAYRASVAPVAYGGAYSGLNRGVYGGSYAAPQVGAIARPVAVAQPYGGRYEDESYKPYSFGYSTVDEYGTQLGRQEAADGNGGVRGSYSYRDPNGQFRQVEYVADAGGFRAEVNTNEAGVVSHRPADAVYNVHNK